MIGCEMNVGGLDFDVWLGEVGINGGIFDRVVDECDESSAFICLSISTEGGVVGEADLSGFGCEFCFLYACDVDVIVLEEMSELVFGCAQTIDIYLKDVDDV